MDGFQDIGLAVAIFSQNAVDVGTKLDDVLLQIPKICNPEFGEFVGGHPYLFKGITTPRCPGNFSDLKITGLNWLFNPMETFPSSRVVKASIK